MIGKNLARYRITAKLGEGAMGVVYRAEDSSLKRSVALKVLAEDVASDEELMGRFEREAEALAALDHPNIVAVHSIEEADGVRFFTMQHIDGDLLSGAIPEGGLTPGSFFELAIPLCDAVAAAHEKGIVHRDLKPANLIVGRDGRLRVLDFGLAKLCGEGPQNLDSQDGTQLRTQDGRLVGTIAYMSPEQAMGKPVDARSDVFSLGVILYEMATGRHPFLDGNHVATLSSIVKDTPAKVTDLRPELPSRLAQIVERALLKDPEVRFQTAGNLRDELVDLQQEVESEVLSPARTGGHGRWKWILAGAGIIAAISLTLALLFSTQGVDGPPEDATTENPAVASRSSIAVLPFDNLSPDPGNEYFSLGMTEELVGKLSRVGTLRVRSTPDGWEPRGIGAVGEELGVDYVLEGSVRKAGNDVRISARLIDVESAVHLWSGDFDGDLSDVFTVQERTALQIVEALDINLARSELDVLRRRPTGNPEAYDAYLKGWALVESLHASRDGAERRLSAAKEHFNRALQLDDQYPLALAGLALVESYSYFLRVDRDASQLERARQYVDEALELAPGLPQALLALGGVEWNAGNYAASADALRRALLRDRDNGYAWCELAAACNRLDPPDLQEAELAARNAVVYQPGYSWGHYQLGWTLSRQKRYGEAVEAFEHAIELAPDIRSAHLRLGDSYRELGQLEEALESYRRAENLRQSEGLAGKIAAVEAELGSRR